MGDTAKKMHLTAWKTSLDCTLNMLEDLGSRVLLLGGGRDILCICHYFIMQSNSAQNVYWEMDMIAILLLTFGFCFRIPLTLSPPTKERTGTPSRTLILVVAWASAVGAGKHYRRLLHRETRSHLVQ